MLAKLCAHSKPFGIIDDLLAQPVVASVAAVFQILFNQFDRADQFRTTAAFRIDIDRTSPIQAPQDTGLAVIVDIAEERQADVFQKQREP